MARIGKQFRSGHLSLICFESITDLVRDQDLKTVLSGPSAFQNTHIVHTLMQVIRRHGLK
jgi:hypothetical protein